MVDLTMSSSFRFLSLPPELRHMIYTEYVYIDGGYVLDSPGWKLTGAGRPKHQFALQGTCKFIHEEMQGLALRHNTITFSALWSWWESVQASRWQRLMCTGPMTAFDLQIMMAWYKRETIDDDMRERIARDYPCFLPHLDWLRGPHPPIPAKDNDDDREKIFNQLGERPSLFRSYLWDILGPHPNDYCRDFPWAILPASELDKLASDLEKKYRNRFPEESSRTKEYWEVPSDDQRWNYRFSAAAYAIEFLRRHPSIRRHMVSILPDS
ncbi:uncharacterized protein F4807DRAFT_237823 [Annulohypoxylon truncatum]|uniref:uncharacterized protein n=1 Tax=Annulohypoxylon truncatum TaxID=327061 RepID=UPI002007DD9E|nr:uncharacterized protein F4807DRAFT_237823 [Annulohypoxylon truncatum]KAI1206120.1 hypothetical protein F4807DRAFT_237823 [Annulohypoxylon truncatum]